MAEEIATQCATLKLGDDEEDDVVDLREIESNETNDNLSLLLIGKLISDRPFNVEAFKWTMMGVWAPDNGMVIKVLGPNLFVFQFFHWKDKEKVYNGRPWCWENKLIVLKEVDEHEQPDQVILTSSPFWIHGKIYPSIAGPMHMYRR